MGDRYFRPEAHILSIPIRPDVTVQIATLPHDLTPAEAEKIARVIAALASVEKAPTP